MDLCGGNHLLRHLTDGDCKAFVLLDLLFHAFYSADDGGVVSSSDGIADHIQGYVGNVLSAKVHDGLTGKGHILGTFGGFDLLRRYLHVFGDRGDDIFRSQGLLVALGDNVLQNGLGRGMVDRLSDHHMGAKEI